MKFTYSPDGRCYYILDELPYNAFDKSGRIGLQDLGKLLEGSREQRGIHSPDAKWHTASARQNLVFIRSQTYEIYPAFYTVLSQNQSVKIISYLSHIGKTSYCIDEELLDLITHEPLARSSCHAVVISKETRRPISLPPETAQVTKVIQPRFGKRPLPDPKFPKKPSKYFMHRRTVMASDTDTQEHVNQAGYLQFSLDCVSMAALKGALVGFQDDIAYSDAKRVWIRYMNEVNTGEEVTISCWGDDDSSRSVWVELTKGPKVIGHCQIEFYEESNKEKGSVSQAKL